MQPRDLRRALVAGVVFAACVALDELWPMVRAPHTEAFWGWLVGAMLNVFGFIGSHAVTVAVTVAHVAVQIALAVGHAMVLVGGVFMRIYGVLGRFWSSVLRPTLSFIVRQFDRFTTWLKNTLGPVIRVIERIRNEVQKIYDRYLRPVLDVIDATRRLLQILAVLHVPFARTIDRKLAELEDRLLVPIRFVMQKLNEALDWINRIVTLDGLLQRVTLLRSAFRDIAMIERVWHNTKSRPMSDADRAAARAGGVWATTDEVIAERRAALRVETSSPDPLIEELVRDVRLRLRNAPGTI